MKKNKWADAFLLLFSVGTQLLYFSFNSFETVQNAFVFDHVRSLQQVDVMWVMALLLPTVMTIFITENAIAALTNGYGKLMLIRNYSKTRLILRNRAKLFAETLVVVLVQLGAYQFFNPSFQKINGSLPLALLLYTCTLFALLSLQGLLELYFQPQICAIAVILYAAVSYVCAYHFFLLTDLFRVPLLFFPALLFGNINGVVDGVVNPFYMLGWVLFLIVLFQILTIRKFKKTDIF